MPIMGPASLLDPAINYSLASSDVTASYLHVPLRVCPPANARISDVHRPLNITEYRAMCSVTLNMGQCLFFALLTYSKIFSNAILLFNIQQYLLYNKKY